MASFSIKYIFQMVDQFTGPASKLGAAAAQMSKGVHSAGNAANAAVASVSKLAGATGSAASSMSSAASAAASYARSLMSIGSAASSANGKLAPMLAGQNHRGAAWSIAQKNAAAAAASGGGNGTPVVGWGGKFTNMAAGLYLGRQMVHGADTAITKVADVDTMRRKLEMTWGGGAEGKANADMAVAKATSLSGKFKNTTIAENLHIIDDLRANLPEQADEIIGHSLEPFVKLHSFFKGWQGGKHAGGVSSSLKDIGIAIRSGELAGNMTGKQIETWVKDLAVDRAWYGEKFKLDEWFKAQKAAMYALPGTSDRFKHNMFAPMVQRMGIGAGTGLATAFNKLVGGITVHQGTAEAWRDLGLMDMSQVKLAKNGKIDPASLANKDFLRGGKLYESDPDLYITKHLLPALAKKGGIKGLTPAVAKQIEKAYDTQDSATLAKLMPPIVKDPKLLKALAPLGKDRRAVMSLYGLIETLASASRDAEGRAKIKAGQGEYDGYDVAKQRLSASLDRAANTVFGTDSVGVIIGALDALGGAMEKTAKAAKALQEGSFLPDAVTNLGRKLFGTTGTPLDQQMADVARNQATGGWSPSQYFAPSQPYNSSWGIPSNPFGSWTKLKPMEDYKIPDSAFGGVNVNANPAASIPQSMAVHVDPIRVDIPQSIQMQVNVSGTVDALKGTGFSDIPISAQPSRGTATPDAGAATGQSSTN